MNGDENATDDVRAREQAEDALHEEWGPEYRASLDAVRKFIDRAPAGLRERLIEARYQDGSQVFNDPEAVKFFLDLEEELDPAARIIPPGGAADLPTLEQRRDEILKVMRTDRARYNADEKMQRDLRSLFTAIERKKSRAT